MSPEVVGTTTLLGGYAHLIRPHERAVYNMSAGLEGLATDSSYWDGSASRPGFPYGIERDQQVLIGAAIGSNAAMDAFWVPDGLARDRPFWNSAEQLARGPGGRGLVAYRPLQADAGADGISFQNFGFVIDGSGRKRADLIVKPIQGNGSFLYSDFTAGMAVTDTDIRFSGAYDFIVFDFDGNIIERLDRFPGGTWDGLAEWETNWTMGYSPANGRVWYQHQYVYDADGTNVTDRQLFVWPPLYQVFEQVHSSNPDRTGETQVGNIRDLCHGLTRYGRPLKYAAHMNQGPSWALADDGSMYGFMELVFGTSPTSSTFGAVHDYQITEWWLFRVTPDGHTTMLRKVGQDPHDSGGITTVSWDDFWRSDRALGGDSLPWRPGAQWVATRAATAQITSHTLTNTAGAQTLDLVPGSWDGEGWFTIKPNPVPGGIGGFPPDVWLICRSNAAGTRWVGLRLSYSTLSGFPMRTTLFQMTGSGLQVLRDTSWNIDFSTTSWGVIADGSHVNFYTRLGQRAFVDYTLTDTSELGTYAGVGYNLTGGITDTTTAILGFGWSPKFDREALGYDDPWMGAMYACAGPEGDDVLFTATGSQTFWVRDIYQARPNGSILKVISNFSADLPPSVPVAQNRNRADGPIVYTDFSGAPSVNEDASRVNYEPSRGY